MSGYNARCHFFNCICQLCLDRAFAINRLTESVDNPALEFWANGHLENAAGTLTRLTFFEAKVITQHDSAHRVSLKVQGHAVDTAIKFDHLTIHHISKAIDSDNTVRHAYNCALIFSLSSDVQRLYALLDNFTDFGWI